MCDVCGVCGVACVVCGVCMRCVAVCVWGVCGVWRVCVVCVCVLCWCVYGAYVVCGLFVWCGFFELLIKHAPLPWVILHAVGIQLVSISGDTVAIITRCRQVTVFPLQFYSVSYSLNCVCIFTFTAHRNLWIL